MPIDASGIPGDEWFARGLQALRAPAAFGLSPEWFRRSEHCHIARAPGRLDVMGGIADYSGSVVLEMPIDRSTTVIVQASDDGEVDVASVRDGTVHRTRLPVAALRTSLGTRDALRAYFAGRPAERWAAYVMGVAQACLDRVGDRDVPGVRLTVLSDVPEGKGVSSSAALEVACLYALASCWDVAFTEGEAAAACQRAENEVAGAPCGIMDQVTSVSGQQHRLLRLTCQPATIEGQVRVPDAWRFFGIDSGIRHAVTGADYGTVRTAAFMGYRIIAHRLGLHVEIGDGRARVHDPTLHGYLANMSPATFVHEHARALPERIDGASFLAHYGGITDTVTTVDPARTYPVRQATAHPIHENARVREFAALLASPPVSDESASEMGRLMRASHDSYGACGLGSDGTDRLVHLVEAWGARRGLYGAKITGGGSGGTVAVLARADARDAVHDVARQYELDTGRRAEVFDGSSPGAGATGVLLSSVPA